MNRAGPHYARGLPFGLAKPFAGGLRRLLEDAAALGLPEAQLELSLLLERQGDASGSKQWEAKAAESGHPRACLNLASRLASAKEPDYPAAVSWYERAAGAGNAEAAARLCKMHLAGQGVARDEIRARAWFDRAAALGHDWSRG